MFLKRPFAIADRGVAEATILASPAGFALRAASLADTPAGYARTRVLARLIKVDGSSYDRLEVPGGAGPALGRELRQMSPTR
jgi:hypothetical protein